MKCKIYNLSYLHSSLESNFRSWSKWPFECVYKTNHLDTFHLLCLNRLYFNGLKCLKSRDIKLKNILLLLQVFLKGSYMLIFFEILEWFSLSSLSWQCLWVKSVSRAHNLYSKLGWCLKAAGSVAQYSALWSHGAQPWLYSRSRGHITSGFLTNLM